MALDSFYEKSQKQFSFQLYKVVWDLEIDDGLTEITKKHKADTSTV